MTHRWLRIFFLGLLLGQASFIGTPSSSLAVENSSAIPGDAKKGWGTFFSKNCIQCHAVWGKGGHIGPDLGRKKMSPLTAVKLATAMWNHIPKMYAKMELYNISFTKLELEEMADLFAFLYFIQFLDEPGNALEGKRVLATKGCSQCHVLTREGGGIGPDLTKWSAFINPVIWAQKMWEHAPKMKEVMESRGITWPELTGVDLSNVIAYIRSLGDISEKEHLLPGTSLQGEKIFKGKGCVGCHVIGPHFETGKVAIGKINFPATLAEMAMRMWNHFPMMSSVMEARGIEFPKMSAQEMADLIAYLFAIRAVDVKGEALKGKEIFMKNGCSTCHMARGSIKTEAPDIDTMRGNVTPIVIANQLWRSAGKMLGEMRERGISWPIFKEEEIGHLIEFLNHPEGESQK